jgi:hypothetical protein
MKASEIFEGENSSLRKTFNSIASSPQPEEWRSDCCDEKLNLICVGCLHTNEIEQFIRDEIRKAEEKQNEKWREKIRSML